MAKKGGGGCGLVVLALLAALVAFGYYRQQQGSPTAPPVEAGSGSGRYVALGDSYVAAPGTGKAVGTPPGCDRSANNYPHLVAAALGLADFADVSCSGAQTAHLSSAQRTEEGTAPPQLDAVTGATTLVTIGIGGNDVGFIDLARTCATANPNGSPCRDRLTAGGRDKLAEGIDAAASRVGGALAAISRKAPKARVFVVGYPSVLPADDGCWPVLPYGAPDIVYLRESLARMNEMLAGQAAAHGVGFVDTAAPSTGGDMCADSDARWVEGLVPLAPGSPLHPNPRGNRGMADAVLKAVR